MARRKKWRDDFVLWTAQAAINGFRAVLQVREWFAPPAKKQKLRAFRKMMDAVERDRKEVFRRIKAASPEETLALSDAFEDRWNFTASPGWEKIKAERDASRDRTRRIKEESAELRAILHAHGNDSTEAIDELRDYVAAHPDSDLACKYLGGVFCKRREWDKSIAAYRRAEAIAMQDVARRGTVQEYSVAVARLHIGDVLHEKGDLEAALAQYNFLIQNAPPDQSFPACYAYLKLGNVYQQLNRTQDARASWKAAMKRDETGIIAKQARQKLKGG